MNSIDAIQEAQRKASVFMETQGDIRGLSLVADYQYIKYRLGDEGVKRVENEMETLGYPLPLAKIKQMEFYPIGYAGVIELAIERSLGFTMEDYYEMGRYAPKSSIILKVMLKYLSSLDSAMAQVSIIWRKYYTIGNLEPYEINKEDRRIIFRLTKYEIAPSTCEVIRGYLSQVTQMVLNKPVRAEERACTFKGDLYHEFVLTW
ncbi:MAG: hypothetical protein Q8P70_00590 [bacterium]|nr:hypothetical protein [bacterium]